MSTYGEVFDSIRPTVRLYSVDDLDGLPLVEAKIDVTASDGAKALPVGDKGPQGDPGEPGAALLWQYHVDDDADIPSASILGVSDTGKAWANTVTGTVWVWTGTEFMEILNGLGVPGPPGPAGDISIGTVTTTPAGGSADASATGSPLARKLNLVIPSGSKGPVGDMGPSAPIASSSDYDGTTPPANGNVLEWQSAALKYKPVAPKKVTGPWTLIDSDFLKTKFSDVSTFVTSTPLVIPAQTFKYRFWVSGCIYVQAGSQGTTISVQVETVASPIVVARGASGMATNSSVGADSSSRLGAVLPITPYSAAKLVPGSATGEMPAGVAQSLRVKLVREFGTANYNVVQNAANSLQVWLFPV